MNGPFDIHPKVVGSTLGGSAALVVVWLLQLCHVGVTVEQASAIVVVLGALGGWLAPILKQHSGEPVVVPPDEKPSVPPAA